jgi:predicted DNA-binding transcriptional regulator AlpA
LLNGNGIDLATFLTQPALAAKLSRMERAELLAQTKALEGILVASLLADGVDHVEMEDDRLINVDEAAARLSVTVDFLYRQKKLPFRVEIGPGKIRFSSNGINQYIRTRQGRKG